MHPTNESQQANTGKPVRGKPFSAYPRQLAIRQGRIAYSEPSQSNCHNRPQISNVEKKGWMFAVEQAAL